MTTPTRLPAATRPTTAPAYTARPAPPPATRAPTRTPQPTVPPIQVTAWVSDPSPEQGVDVKVYGRLLVNGQPVKGKGMVARWRMKGRVVDCVGDTAADGIAECSVNTYGVPSDYTVKIEIFIGVNEPAYRAYTEVTIR